MRYLVYSLVLANLAVFAWYRFSPLSIPAESQLAPVPAGVAPLVLLSERSGVPGEVSSVKQAAEPERSPEQSQTKAIETAPAAEPEDEAGRDAPRQEVRTGRKTDGVQAERVCRTVGPMVGKADANSISALLSQRGIRPTLREDTVQQPAGYWVYLPGMPARDARRIVADLDARGMKDYYIGQKNHISLGIFSNKDKAEGRQQKVIDMGYDALLEPRFRSRTVYWLDAEEAGAPFPSSGVWEDLRRQYSGIEIQRVDCR